MTTMLTNIRELLNEVRKDLLEAQKAFNEQSNLLSKTNSELHAALNLAARSSLEISEDLQVVNQLKDQVTQLHMELSASDLIRKSALTRSGVAARDYLSSGGEAVKRYPWKMTRVWYEWSWSWSCWTWAVTRRSLIGYAVPAVPPETARRRLRRRQMETLEVMVRTARRMGKAVR